MSDKPYVGQVIIEREFSTREAAEAWMHRMEIRVPMTVHVEKHLWEPASPIGAKEVT